MVAPILLLFQDSVIIEGHGGPPTFIFENWVYSKFINICVSLTFKKITYVNFFKHLYFDYRRQSPTKAVCAPRSAATLRFSKCFHGRGLPLASPFASL